MIIDQFGSKDPKKSTPPMIAAMVLQELSLSILSPELAQDCYVKYNTILDKDPAMKMLVEPLVGDSSLFESSTETWQHKRKALGSAFYKNKLTKMLEIVKVIVQDKMKEWEEKYVKEGKVMNAMEELEDIHMRIIMGCAFGLDSQHFLIKQWKDGK
mmetsp:Transcript_25393/g.19132  ORF Transcript_25393/g.19132 Transcript_25393/m.19132 type:complete len:156 (-) Transcript_25393:1037-1504(-)|eukprot:CAMPEP_0202964830 /NCGR_PEP_ID=MMETSP1396-20130829/8933_1 /ASSEMBLY_ACC=CAM_ASM_000872 /TAXON_ID= /ORGANISM="Pseudokeronopsis sp., Strain Brazil" /LENGTH=155 /DNA_ID=CAMNT_0049687241 /DNA_START=215 /DNA_END=682 /DNA_ORIENTATION=+